MPPSNALREFEEALQMARQLLALERTYRNPPETAQQAVVRGLRGGAAVLMVAAFEAFLKKAFEERLSDLGARHSTLSFSKLPDKMRVNHIYLSLERAMKGPPHQEPIPKIERLPEIDRICRLLPAGVLNPAAFCETGGNPSPRTVNSLFSSVALDNVLGRVKSKFDRRWKKPTAARFLEDKLEEIVNRRHIVAHTADALNIGRSDLKESVRFLSVLATLLDFELESHTKHLESLCTIGTRAS